MHTLLVQIVGFAATTLGVLSFQVNNRMRLLSMQLLSSALWSLHFYLLGAFEGSALNAVGFVRVGLFALIPIALTRQRQIALSAIIVLYFAASWLTWHSAVSALPLVASIASSFALWQSSAGKIRYLSLINPPLWFSYNFISGSYPGMLNEIVVFTSVLIGIYRYNWQPKLKYAFARVRV